MGRANPPSPAAAPPSSTLKHFTHPHDLHPQPLYNPQTVCSGCRLQSSGTMYTCIPCNFTLHQSCANLPQLITHPSHPGCTLSLLTVSTYPGGVFSCNACDRRSNSWNYHCAACEYDLHVSCASKPLKTRHVSHASCELDLTFKNPYVNSEGFSCDICRKIGSKQWLYRCRSCEFDVHLDCTTVQLQRQQSAPAPPHAVAPQPLQHSMSLGGNQNPNMYYPVNPGQPVVQMNNGLGLGGTIMAAAFKGFVEGALQEVGQTVVQEVINDAGGGGGIGGVDAVGGDGGGEEAYAY